MRYLPLPIQMDARVWFSAGNDVVTVMIQVHNRTRFPDFEYRVGVDGRPPFRWERCSSYAGPMSGLSASPISDSMIVASISAPTSKYCGGTCP